MRNYLIIPINDSTLESLGRFTLVCPECSVPGSPTSRHWIVTIFIPDRGVSHDTDNLLIENLRHHVSTPEALSDVVLIAFVRKSYYQA